MTSRAAALAYASGLAVVTTAFAASTDEHRPHDANRPANPGGTSVATKWVPEWLMEPISRALKDATDPRDRKR